MTWDLTDEVEERPRQRDLVGTCLCVQRTVSVSEVNGEGKEWQGAQVLARPL